jgi:hypothetical protein
MAISRSNRHEGRKLSIVYDPARETLSKEVISSKQRDNYEQVTVEGTDNPVSIFLDIGEGEAKTRSLLARVDLGQLGWSEKLQRHLGNTREIWVKGRVPPSSYCERAVRAESWPRGGKSGCGLDPPTLRHYPASYSGP